MATKNAFREVSIRPLTGLFDAQSDPDQIGVGNYSVVKNLSTRGTRNRCRRGGWERFLAEETDYNNQDLHDQLLDQQIYGDVTTYNAFSGGTMIGLSYPFLWPAQNFPSYGYTSGSLTTPTCGYYPNFGLTGLPSSSSCFTTRFLIGFPYNYIKPFYGGCNGGSPNFYAYSYYYTDCPFTYPAHQTEEYPYGPAGGIYSPYFSFQESLCTPVGYPRVGCNEAITHLNEVSAEGSSRKLIAATLSRIYALNETTGNWKVLADGLGNAAYTGEQCGCNDVRFTSATLGSYIFLTNGFDDVLAWSIGDDSVGSCDQAARGIGDLAVLGITAAGGVVSWKGFMILYDILENGVRHGGKLIWSDFEDPTSWIPSDVSAAGEATVAPGEKFIGAAEMGNFLYLYSDRSIWRVTLLGGDVMFSFDRIYSGTSALKYRYTLVSTGKEHIYLGATHIYMVTQFDTRPIEVEWLNKVSPVIFNGLNEDDASFGPINELRCDQAVADWNEEFKEVWISWPTGNNNCPNMTLVLNMQYSAADLVDHGFTALHSFHPDSRLTLAAFFEQFGVCSTQELVDTSFREGLPCGATKRTSTLLTPSLSTTTLPLWATTAGSVDLIGNNGTAELTDILPGHGLYVDMAGSARGTIQTRSNLTFTAGHTFRLSFYVAGNQRVSAVDILSITVGGGLLSGNINITNYLQDSNKNTFTFVGNGTAQKITVAFSGGTQLPTTSTGPLLVEVVVEDVTAGTVIFYDDFNTQSPIVPSSFNPGAARSILNQFEDLALPADPDSLCAKLAGMTEDDFCRDCGITTKFVMADATDFALKQYRDDAYYREQIFGSYLNDYCGYACDNVWYACYGYDSVLQSGAQDFNTDADKLINMIKVEVKPVQQTTPTPLQMSVGYSAQAVCDTWVALPPKDMNCQSDFNAAQLLSRGIRMDGRLTYPTFYRGKYLHWRLKISGVGGGACLSEVIQVVKGIEMNPQR